jgi:TolB protein
MKRKSLFLLFALFCARPIFAAEAPTIKISKNDSIPIAVSPISGADGGAVTKTLSTDLALSGYFSSAPASSANFIITGVSSGGSLEGKVVDHDGKTVVMNTYNGTSASKAHAFADDIIHTITGNRGFATGKIAFVATRSGHKEIYVADYDGSNVQQLTHDNNISVHPQLSPDGRKLAYTGYKSGYADIYEINLVSGARDRIVKFPGTNTGASYAPDSNRIAATLSKDGNPELYVISGGAHRLTHTPGVESSPTWSPNGDEIIYSYDDRGGPQLYRISAGGGNGQLVQTGHGYCTEPDWSPDGAKVAFNVREGGVFQIAILDLQSGVTHIVATGENPAWGPDSRHLIYADGGALYLLDAQTGKKSKVLDGLGKITEPSWSR